MIVTLSTGGSRGGDGGGANGVGNEGGNGGGDKGEGGGSGNGGSDNEVTSRGPQSVQSYPRPQVSYSAPGPPSPHIPFP